jgi:hypothetical protein
MGGNDGRSGKDGFLSPSDSQLGDVMFKAGLYQGQQIDEGQEHILVFTGIVSAPAPNSRRNPGWPK